jgi:hypothetical protein
MQRALCHPIGHKQSRDNLCRREQQMRAQILDLGEHRRCCLAEISAFQKALCGPLQSGLLQEDLVLYATLEHQLWGLGAPIPPQLGQHQPNLWLQVLRVHHDAAANAPEPQGKAQ